MWVNVSKLLDIIAFRWIPVMHNIVLGADVDDGGDDCLWMEENVLTSNTRETNTTFVITWSRDSYMLLHFYYDCRL